MSNETPIEAIELAVAPDPRLARLVRMTAANVAALSSMSVDRIEDIRMAAEEAFIYACGAAADQVTFRFEVDPAHVVIDVELGAGPLPEGEAEGPAAYADLILGAVCDAYEKTALPARLHLELKADV